MIGSVPMNTNEMPHRRVGTISALVVALSTALGGTSPLRAQSADPFQAAPGPAPEPAKPAARPHIQRAPVTAPAHVPERVVIQRVYVPAPAPRREPAPQTELAPQAQPVPAAPAPATRQFDGYWLMTVVCQDSGSARGYSYQLIGQVTDGRFRAQRGVPNQPNSDSFDGIIQADGRAQILSNGLTGGSAYSFGNRPEGSPFAYHINAQFQATRGTGTRVEHRPCTFDFVRQ